ncbi:hypothetical protein HYX13_04865 [Candidatus Woesearchaeota archaeon]|nr:hypothetical protein [Candidatus Woesearchaeota archaeon]
MYLFLADFSFVSSARVFASLGEGMHLLKRIKKKIPGLLFTAVLILAVLQIVLIPIKKSYLLSSSGLLLIDLGLFLIFLSWFRLYVVRTVHHT